MVIPLHQNQDSILKYRMSEELIRELWDFTDAKMPEQNPPLGKCYLYGVPITVVPEVPYPFYIIIFEIHPFHAEVRKFGDPDYCMEVKGW